MLSRFRSPGFDAALIVFLAGLLLYLPTLQPGIGWYNAPELVCAALTLDVPHSPGYPLFTRLASVAIQWVPWGDPAWRVNLLSAVLGAAAAGAWAAWLAGWGTGRAVAACAGIWLLAVPTFWEQATSSEVYTLECLLFALFMLAVQSARDGRIGFGKSLLVGLLLAFGIGHRPTFALLACASAFSCVNTRFLSRIDASSIAGFAAGALIGTVPTLDLFLRLQNENRVLIDPLIGRGVEGFWSFFSGAQYRNAIGVFGVGELAERLSGWLVVVTGAGCWIPVLAVASFLASTPAWPVYGAALWMCLVNTGFVLNYNAFEAHTMLLPTLMAIGALAAMTLADAGRKFRRPVTLAIVLATAVSVPVAATRIEPRSRASEVLTRRLAATVPNRGVLMMNNDIEFRPFYYLRLTKGLRPDLGIRLVDDLTASDALELDAEAVRGALFGPLVYPASAASVLGARYLVEPWGYLWRIRTPGHDDAVNSVNPGWKRMALAPGAEMAIDPQVEVVPLGGSTGRIASDVLLPGDVLVYRYAIPRNRAFRPVILKAELTTRDRRGFDEAGVKTGHDIHFVVNRDNLPERLATAGYDVFQRTIVVPDDARGTEYELTMCIVELGNAPPSTWVTNVLPGAHRLNMEGATELFRLRHGMGGKPLFLTGGGQGIDDATQSAPISLARFRGSPNIP